MTGPEIIAPEEQWAWGELLAALSFLYRILKFVAVIPDTEVSDYHHPARHRTPEWARKFSNRTVVRWKPGVPRRLVDGIGGRAI